MSLLMLTASGYAQDIDADQVRSDLQDWQLDQQETFSAIERSSTEIQANLNKSVFIKQMGDTNTAFIDVFSNAYAVEVTQAGDYNAVDINESALQITKNIIQNGNNNTYFENSYSTGEHTMIDVNQEGSNLYFEKFGSNALSNKIKLKMTGNSKTVILRNF